MNGCVSTADYRFDPLCVKCAVVSAGHTHTHREQETEEMYHSLCASKTVVWLVCVCVCVCACVCVCVCVCVSVCERETKRE